jgi:hypothetical protein
LFVTDSTLILKVRSINLKVASLTLIQRLLEFLFLH